MAAADPFGPLISPEALRARLTTGAATRIIDTRWRLARPSHGSAAYAEARLPGAIFLDLDDDLSDIGDPTRGRHPLPPAHVAASRLARAGLDRRTPVVVYDDLGGAVASRLWWMLGWLGGPPAAVLDGGFDAWRTARLPLEHGPARAPRAAPDWSPAVRAERLATIDEVAAGVPLLIDARAAERYRGEVELVDPRAGHIPGARSAPWSENLVDGRIADAATLRARFEALGVSADGPAVCYCGSGVTACHNLLALEVAGLAGGRLFAGSWSAWCHRPDAIIAAGDEASG